ncbi:hypothetical protein ACT2CI_00445 [Candidatus Vidania fulgoroideorum]
MLKTNKSFTKRAIKTKNYIKIKRNFTNHNLTKKKRNLKKFIYVKSKMLYTKKKKT